MATPDDLNRLGVSKKKDFPYFRRVWTSVVAALMAASFIPLILIGGGGYIIMPHRP